MWYFAWILGLGLACSFAILNAMWLDVQACQAEQDALRAGGADRDRGEPA